MRDLKGTRTHENLRAAFAAESRATRRYLYCARAADAEGHADLGGQFCDTLEAEAGHVFGHLDFLRQAGDPATGLPFGKTRENLRAAIEGETGEFTEMFPGMARAARDEGFPPVADWFETLARAERSHAGRFNQALAELEEP